MSNYTPTAISWQASSQYPIWAVGHGRSRPGSRRKEGSQNKLRHLLIIHNIFSCLNLIECDQVKNNIWSLEISWVPLCRPIAELSVISAMVVFWILLSYIFWPPASNGDCCSQLLGFMTTYRKREEEIFLGKCSVKSSNSYHCIAALLALIIIRSRNFTQRYSDVHPDKMRPHVCIAGWVSLSALYVCLYDLYSASVRHLLQYLRINVAPLTLKRASTVATSAVQLEQKDGFLLSGSWAGLMANGRTIEPICKMT